MYTVNSQPIFNPMQTTIFKQAHTGTCINNYDLNSIVALSNLFQSSNSDNMKEQPKDDCHSNMVTSSESLLSSMPINNVLQSSLDNQTSSLLNALTSNAAATKSDNDLLNNLKISLFQQQLSQLQAPSNALFNASNTLNLASTLRLLSNANQLNNQQTRPNKRQKVIPNPLQLSYSNLNPTNQLQNEQVQPLDLSIKSASSTNSTDRFILDPMNLLNRSDDELDKTIVNNKIQNAIIDNSNLVQIQNALCKKKKMAQQAAEILKKSSFSSAPNSPSSIATSSSPFDLDNSHSNQSNLSNLLPINEAESVQAFLNSKKRKFSESSFLESSANSQVYLPNSTAVQMNVDKPKLKAKRKSNKRKASVNSLESIELKPANVQQINQDLKPSTIIIDAENTFPCPICGEIFAFKDRLSKHIKSKHRTECTDQINSNSNGLSTSQANGRNSPNQRSYVCNECGCSFARSDMLTRHSRVHSGLKPYSCDICKNKFTRSDHLATHRRTHSGEKPYKCSGCDYKACRRDMITRHMKRHLTENGGKTKPSTVVLLAPTKNNNKTNKTNDLVEKSKTETVATNSNVTSSDSSSK